MPKIKSGIGGILILVAADLIFRPISYVIRIIGLSVVSVFEPDFALELLKLILYFIMFVLVVVTTIFFGMKKKAFKPLYIILLWGDILIALLFTFLSLAATGETSAAPLGWTLFFGTAAIGFTIYIFTSSRVKNTFIH